MARRVKGPDGVIHLFPDDASDAEIGEALAGIEPPKADPPHMGLFDRFANMIGLQPSAEMQQMKQMVRDGTPMKDVLQYAHNLDLKRTQPAINALPAIGGAAGALAGGPVGAAIGGAGGEAFRQLDARVQGQAAPATPTDAALGIGTQGALQAGATVAGNAIGAGLAKAAPRVMQSALKPTQSLLNEYKTKAPQLVKTLLDEGVNVTENGLGKLQRLFDATNQEIKSLVAESTGTVEKKTVASRALQTANTVSRQVNPTADLKAVGDTVEEFLNHPVYQGQRLTVPEAQAMKIGTYQQVGRKYGEVSNAGIEAQKALARGLKEDIAAEVPAISALNQKDSELMAAMDAVGRRVALAGNRDPVGFAWVTTHPVTFLTALMDRSPAVKSMLARGLYKTAAIAGRVSEQAIRTAMHAIAADTNAPGDGLPPQ